VCDADTQAFQLPAAPKSSAAASRTTPAASTFAATSAPAAGAGKSDVSTAPTPLGPAAASSFPYPCSTASRLNSDLKPKLKSSSDEEEEESHYRLKLHRLDVQYNRTLLAAKGYTPQEVEEQIEQREYNLLHGIPDDGENSCEDAFSEGSTIVADDDDGRMDVVMQDAGPEADVTLSPLPSSLLKRKRSFGFVAGGEQGVEMARSKGQTQIQMQKYGEVQTQKGGGKAASSAAVATATARSKGTRSRKGKGEK